RCASTTTPHGRVALRRMIDRFARLPASLRDKARTVRLRPGDIPALLCHPDWVSPAPACIWMHGRAANKELDSGRYIRWVKAGLGRLCAPHDFRCAAVEGTSGDLWSLYRPDGPRPWGQAFEEGRVAPLDPMRHLAGVRPLPLLALHSEADRIIPWEMQRGFLE